VSLRTDAREKILELQEGLRTFIARLSDQAGLLEPIPLGSRLELTGVYVAQGSRSMAGWTVNSFELLLNSPSDIRIMARPPFWTLSRMLAMVGGLLALLAVTAVWISLLRRQVERRTHQLQNEIQERENQESQRKLEEERIRIARDLHDDLGGSLTEISLQADLGSVTPPTLEKAAERFRTIAEKARHLVSTLDVIVWLVNPRKDVLPFLISYLGSYARDYISLSAIKCRLKIPSDIPAIPVTSKVRHGLFLAVKEVLRNVACHAHATEVTLEVKVSEWNLEISVEDNGRGFDPAASTSGNGLSNLRERMTGLGGQCLIDSQPHRGTIATLILPLKTRG
jgi:signal transduction histidine kinase